MEKHLMAILLALAMTVSLLGTVILTTAMALPMASAALEHRDDRFDSIPFQQPRQPPATKRNVLCYPQRGSCPLQGDPRTDALQAESIRPPSLLDFEPVEIREFLESIGIDDDEVTAEMLDELRDKHFRGELWPLFPPILDLQQQQTVMRQRTQHGQKHLEMDSFSVWLEGPSPRDPTLSRLQDMLGGRLAFHNPNRSMKLDTDDLLFQELFYRALMMSHAPEGTESGGPLARLIQSIRSTRAKFLFGTMYSIRSKRESLYMLYAGFRSTGSLVLVYFGVLLVYLCLLAALNEIYEDHGRAFPPLAFMLSLSGLEYILAMARWAVFDSPGPKPTVDRYMHGYQQARHWWGIFFGRSFGKRDLSSLDSAQGGALKTKQRKGATAARMILRERRMQASPAASASTDDEGEEYALENLVKRVPVRAVPSTATVSQASQKKPATQQPLVPAPPAQPAYKKKRQQPQRPAVAERRRSLNDTARPSTSKVVSDVLVQPQLTFKEAVAAAALPAVQEEAPQFKLEDYVAEERDGLTPPGFLPQQRRSLSALPSRENLGDSFLSGLSTPSFSFFSNFASSSSGSSASMDILGGASFSPSGTDTPADNLLSAILRRRQHSLTDMSVPEEIFEDSPTASDDDDADLFMPHFLRRKK